MRRRRYAVVAALALFVCLAGLPAILSALHLKVSTALPRSSNGIRLLSAPSALPGVSLAPVARPVRPGLAPATFPQLSAAQEAAAVTAEDNRLRTMLHDSFHTFSPTVVAYPGALPTLVLTSESHYLYTATGRYIVTGQSAFTAADLVRYGALVQLPTGGALLRDNVFVGSGASLDLSSSEVGTIYLDATSGGSASIVAWGGSLDFQGTPRAPLTLRGWDASAKAPASDTGRARPYIRAVAARMTFEYARVSALGFWSGRTGGVAWTGLSTQDSSGGAADTTFTGDTYGAFVSRSEDIHFTDDLFESNQLDGLHIHRYTVGATATFSAAVRNGASGFHVDRAATGTVLQDDVSVHNGTNGFLVDGRPLVGTASPSGSDTSAASGTRIETSEALHNGRTGILVEGGDGTVLKSNEVCAKLTGIALRLGATNATVDGNDVRCSPRIGISVGPVAPRTLLYGNAVSGARIAVLVTSAGGTVNVDKGLITMARIFGISVRGLNSIVTGRDNVISGIGFRTVDSRSDARIPHLADTDAAHWEFAHNGSILTYLEFHPLAVLWLSIGVLVILCGLWVRRRRAPLHPYPESTRWRDSDKPVEPAPVPIGPSYPVKPVRVVPASSLVSLLAGEPGRRTRSADHYRSWPGYLTRDSGAHRHDGAYVGHGRHARREPAFDLAAWAGGDQFDTAPLSLPPEPSVRPHAGSPSGSLDSGREPADSLDPYAPRRDPR
jgi:hypothetical protein